ncbi:hypothetical protein D3C84_749550 [compost metagenome]
MQRQFVEQAVQPFFEGKRLMALTHFQQAEGLTAQLRKIILKTFEQSLEESPRITVARAQAQPETLPMSWQRLTELHRQRTFSEARWCADQQQPATEPRTQTLAQSRSQHMAVGQWRSEKTRVQRSDRDACRTG